MRESEIKNLGGGENIVDKSWYKSSSSIFNFDKNIGDVSDTLKIQGNFETTLFYLPKSALESMLKSQDSSIFKINNIILSATSGDFENGKTPLKLKIYYTYSQQDDCFDKEEFVNNLSSTSFDQAKEDLQKKCPNVKNVDKKETGMNILGIQSRVDVNVIKN
jgi:hypothetical protein